MVAVGAYRYGPHTLKAVNTVLVILMRFSECESTGGGVPFEYHDRVLTISRSIYMFTIRAHNY